jgi:ADP-ribose pyrophosphatase YjhB (NUDIX family)/PKD repeat protein
MQGPNPKGSPNLILHKDGHRYRVRSELLIFKDDMMLISKIDNKINQYGCLYKLPGGGVDDANEYIEEAAAREAEEEVRIRTKNVRYSGQYYEGLYDKIPDWHIHTLHLDGIVYDGYISFICTAEYAGKFNGYIKKMDRDDSINTAKFYSYNEVKGILKPIHREIFEEYLKSRISKESYFGDRINKTLNQEVTVTEGILPKLTFYHGSGTEIKGNYITANSMCLGNRLESASYAVYMWRKRENAYPWALYSLLQIVCEKLNIDFRKIVRLDLFQTPIKINIEESVYDTILNASLGKKCYVYGCSTNITDLGLGHSAYLDEVISKKDVKIVKRETITVTNKFFTDNTSVKSQQWFDSPEEKNKYQNMYAGILTRGVSNLLMYGDDKIFPMRRRIKEKIKEGKFKKGDDLNIIIADIKTEMTKESTEIPKKDFKSVHESYMQSIIDRATNISQLK